MLQAAAAGATLGTVRRARAAKTELRYLNIESLPESVRFLKQISQEYEAATGVRLVVDTIVGTTLWTEVTMAIKSGRPYDLINFAQPTQTILLAQEDQLAPLTDVIDAIGLADFDPVTMVRYKNDLWYLPYNYVFCCLYYRKDWLDAAKLPVPTNWSEFAAAAKALTDASRRRFGTSFPYSTGLTPWGNSGFLWAAGVKIYDDQWNVLLDTPAIKPKLARALQFLRDINPYNAPGQFNMTLINITTNFITGIAGIEGESGGLITDIDTKAPALSDKFVIAPFPAPDGGKGTVVYGGRGIGVSKSANTQAARDFLLWFVKSGRLIDFQLMLPAYMQPVQYSTYKNPKWLNNPTTRKYWPAMQTMQSFTDKNKVNIDAVLLQGPRLSANQGMIVNSEVIMHMYQNVLTGRMSIDAAIDDCARQIRSFTVKEG